MNDRDHDLDDFASLWADEPTREERSELFDIARRVSFRAGLLDLADLGVAAFIAAGLLLAVLLQPAPVTVAIGSVAAFGLLWTSWKRYLLKKQVAQLLEIDDRTDLIDLQIRRVTTDLHRSLIGLFATPPAIILCAMLNHALEQGGSLAGFGDVLIVGLMNVPVGPAVVAGMAALIIQQVNIVRRLRSELRRLQTLGGEYRAEARLDAMAIG